MRLVLTGPSEQWGTVYAHRLTYMKKKQIHLIKQRMQNSVTRMVRLYSEGEGEERAFEEMQKSATRLQDTCQTAYGLLSQVRSSKLPQSFASNYMHCCRLQRVVSRMYVTTPLGEERSK